MNINFEVILFSLVCLSGLVALFDILFLAPRRANSDKKMPWYSDYGRSFFPILLLVFALRSFLIEPFRIPSSSLEPTLLTGDLIFVNKFKYGVKLPVINKMIKSISTPEIGDIVVFYWPPRTSFNFIKRIVAKPGDHVEYKNKQLTINGKLMPQTFIKLETVFDEQDHTMTVEVREEILNGIKHKIYVRPELPAFDYDVVVPPGKYFAMGDNRDDSADSRFWGFVPEENLLGKAMLVWFSWDGQADKIRWNRFGKVVH